MQKFYEKNMKELVKNGFNIEEKVEYLNKITGIEEQIRENQGCLEFRWNDQYYQLYSRKPREEVNFLTGKINYNKDNLIIIFGLGNMELLTSLLKKCTKGTRMVIFEPNPYVLKYMLQNYDLSTVFSSNQVVLLMDFGDKRKFEQEIFNYCNIAWENMVKNLFVLSLPNYYMYKEERTYFVKQFLSGIEVKIKSLGNCLEDIFNGIGNNYKNIDAILETCDIEEIRDKYKGYPGIVVASGPSLDKNINYLSEAQDKALIITCDASLEACKKHGVKPDAIASIERDEPTYLYYYKDKKFEEDLVLIGPSLLWPEIYEEFPGKKILTSKVNTGVEKWWAKHFEKFEFMNQGMSSANVAFALAKLAGCNPIILIGQDLAYTNNKKHSQLTHTEFEGENDSSESDGVMVEDIYGNMIPTDSIYNLFRKWFEIQISENPDLKVIDATEGGAKILGSEIMPLKNAIEIYCQKQIPKHLHEHLTQVHVEEEYAKGKYIEVIDDAKEQVRELKKIQKKAREHYDTLVKLYDLKLEKMKEEQLIDVILNMQKGDKIIQYIQKKEELITYFQQIIRQTIIFVKDIGNNITAENVRKNIRLQVNLMGMIKNSIGLIIQEYEKMISYLSEKLEEGEGGE